MERKKIIIVGAGAFGREVYNWSKDVFLPENGWHLCGFIDDSIGKLQKSIYQAPILNSIRDHAPKNDEYLLMGIGSPIAKQIIAESLTNRGGNFISLVHPSAVLASNVKIGIGVIICPNVTISCDAKLGDFVTLNLNTTVGHDAVVGDYCQIRCHCDITGKVKLGRFVSVGSHGSILPGITVGDKTQIGPGSIVIRDVEEGVTVFGNPARVMLERQRT